MVSLVTVVWAIIIFTSSAGAGVFKLLASNKVCQLGVIQQNVKTLETCKARCAAVAACAYLAWWGEKSKKECVHYSDETCQTAGLSDHVEKNQLFKKLATAFTPTTGTELRSALRTCVTNCASDGDDSGFTTPAANTNTFDGSSMTGFKAIDGFNTTYKITKGGCGWKRVGPDNIVIIHATGVVLATGKVFWSTEGKHKPFMFMHGAGQVVTGLEQGCLGMRRAEERQLIIPAEEGFGADGYPAREIPPNATILFTVKVMDIS